MAVTQSHFNSLKRLPSRQLCIKNLLSLFLGTVILMICKKGQTVYKITRLLLNNTTNNSNYSCLCQEMTWNRLKQNLSTHILGIWGLHG